MRILNRTRILVFLMIDRKLKETKINTPSPRPNKKVVDSVLATKTRVNGSKIYLKYFGNEYPAHLKDRNITNKMYIEYWAACLGSPKIEWKRPCSTTAESKMCRGIIEFDDMSGDTIISIKPIAMTS